MRRESKYVVSVLLVLLTALAPVAFLYGRGGGRGGGGGGRGGGGGARMGGGGGGARMAGGGARPGGGMSRPSGSMGRSPSFSGGARPGGGVSRPSVGVRPGGSQIARPSTGLSPGSRPGNVNFGGGGRAGGGVAGLTPGTRPSIGSGPGIAQLPSGARPGGGARPGIGQGPGISQLPSAPRPGIGGAGGLGGNTPPRLGQGGAGISQLPASPRPGLGGPGGPGAGIPPRLGQGPGISQLPANRPGGGGALAGAVGGGALAGAIGGNTRLPGMGNRPGDRERPSQLPNRTPQERRDNLQDRLSNRDDIRDDWRDHRDDIREDWQDRYQNIYDRHDDWHHGCWADNAGDWWHHMWDDHTAYMAFRTTMWGLNAAAYGFGYWGYSNPYYYESYPVGGGTYVDYSQPMVIEAPVTTEAVAAAPAEAPAPGVSDFDAARQAFYQGDYAGALAATNKALAALPNDPIIHEFRALVMFATGKYKDSAAGLYSVLTAGPGWDWTTLSSLYPNVEAYTKQLRALEAYVKQNTQAGDARFVLAYHYMTTGAKEAAAKQYQELYRQTPQDHLIKQLLLMTAGPEALGASAPSAGPPPAAAPAIPAADLVGNWNAAGQGDSKFAMQLTNEGTFSWTFTQKGKPQTVKGVYALDGNTLAMEPESGGVMLAEVTAPQGGSMGFKLLGAPQNDPGLKFVKS